jgi:Lysylphosphatidylglycerol synthase TM region
VKLRTALLAVGLAVLILLLWQLGASEVVNSVVRVGWYFIPVLVLYGTHHAARALALHSCVVERGRLPYRDALAIRLSGEAVQSLTFSGPFLAEPTRAWLLTRRGLTLQEGFAATITEYLISLFVGAATSIVALVYLVRHFDPAAGVSALAIAVIIFFAVFLIASGAAIGLRFYLIGTIINGLARIGLLRGRLRPNMTWINRMEDLLLAILHDRPVRLMSVFTIEVAAQALLILELFCLMQALDVAAPRMAPLLIEGSTKVTGVAFLFIPLQLGVSEGAYALVFDVLGLPAAAGFALAFVRRFRSLAVASIGLAMLAMLTRHARTR